MLQSELIVVWKYGIWDHNFVLSSQWKTADFRYNAIQYAPIVSQHAFFIRDDSLVMKIGVGHD